MEKTVKNPSYQEDINTAYRQEPFFKPAEEGVKILKEQKTQLQNYKGTNCKIV